MASVDAHHDHRANLDGWLGRLMSDVMLHGVLCIPPELWDGNEMDVRQRYSHYLQASRRIENDECEIARLRRALREIAEEWAGAECGEPVHAQEAYAIALAKRMYSLAAEALTPNVGNNRIAT